MSASPLNIALSQAEAEKLGTFLCQGCGKTRPTDGQVERRDARGRKRKVCGNCNAGIERTAARKQARR